MKIVLRIEGKDKIFTNDFITARSYKNALEIHRKIEANPNIKDEELFEDMFPFIVSVFGKQFTEDEMWDGIRFDKISVETKRIFHTILGIYSELDEDSVGDEGNETGKQPISMPMNG